MDENGRIEIKAEIDDAYPEGYQMEPGALGEGAIKVPLTIYIGEERRIIGDAVLTPDGIIQGYVTPQRDRILRDLLDDGVVQSVSITFNAPPAIPVFKDGTVRWVRNY
jgi:hypothetical protein